MKVFTQVFVYVMITLIITGCDYRPIEDMPMVVGLAIDPIKDEEGYRLTSKVIIPSTGASVEGSSDQVFIQSSGKTIFDAARDFIMKEGQKVFWGQLDFVIIHQSIAEKDITKVLDFLLRDNEIRENLWLLVSKEDTSAEEVIKASYNEKRVRFYIIDAMQNVDAVGKYEKLSLIRFNNELNASGIEPILPFVSIEETLGQKKIIVNGSCIFKDKKRVGHLDGKETQQYRLIMGELAGVYIIDYKSDVGKTKVTLEIANVKSKKKVMKKEQIYDVTIEVDIIGIIGEIENNEISITKEKERDEFIKQAEEQLNKELQILILKVQKEYASDIFGIGEQVKNKYPKEYEKIEDEWNTVFASSNIKVETKVKLTGSSLFKQPLYKED